MANHARWAVERLIDVSRQAPPGRHARHVARRSRKRWISPRLGPSQRSTGWILH